MNRNRLFCFNNYDVYFIVDNSLTYYVSIPKKIKKCIMTISINENAYILNNSITEINNAIKNPYKDFDNTNAILLIPSISNQNYHKLENINNIDIYNETAKYISKIVNSAYKILRSMDITVDSNIKFLSDGVPFIDWFISKYQSRITKIDLLDLLNKYNLKEDNDLEKVNALGVNFIVGNKNNEIDKELTNQLIEIKNPYDDFSEMYKEPEPKPSIAYSTGNISYYFIGTLVVITAIIILLLLIK